MKTLNELSQAKYGKDYAQLPDDGAEQDHIMHEYARQYPTEQEKREAVLEYYVRRAPSKIYLEKRTIDADQIRAEYAALTAMKQACQELKDLWPLEPHELEAYMQATFMPVIKTELKNLSTPK
jgi:hypothetical protein